MMYSPMFEPLWVRLAMILACVAYIVWVALDDLTSIWLWLTVIITAYYVWDFFLSGRYGRKPAKPHAEA